jgi:uncharacterized protein (TIGR00369 family)
MKTSVPVPVDPSSLRSRTYDYAEARKISLEQRTIQGLEYMQAVRDGRLAGPPISYTIGWTLTAVEKGFVRLELVPGEHLANPHVVHGGVLSTLLDSATACAAISTMDEDTMCTSLGINVSYLRAVPLDLPKIVCEGRVIHGGRSAVVAEAEVKDEAGKLYARATATFIVQPNPMKAKAP